MQQNQIQTINSEKSLIAEIKNHFSDLKILGSEITIYTHQENCIREDLFQLWSFVKREFETVKEPYEFYVGKFLKKGIITKQVVKNVDTTDLFKFLGLMILDVFDFFGKEISENNITSMVQLIYKNYYWLKFSEFKLFVEKIKGGHWQQVHNMSPAVFMERLKMFADESLDIREQIGEIENKADKDKETEIPMSEEQRKEFSTFLKELAHKIESSEKQKASEKIHANAELTNQYHKENEAYLQKLKDDGVPGDEAVILYSRFLIREK